MKPIFLITLTLGVVGGILFITFLSNPKESQENTRFDKLTTSMPTQQNEQSKNEQAPTELQIEDIVVGTGAQAQTGNTVSVHYTGTLLNGTKFDSSLDRGTPFSFTLGQNSVIAGWEQGVLGMKIGGKRKLIIPPSLAYGPRATGPIPANSTLVFEVELLNVK
ncbi:MAG: FKBP-type peptidyl-prolyl cis-trans isomerase [bacterium]|nr:FKBP-type peptidyl-prolyl cis-trans isomerase [bacterium]